MWAELCSESADLNFILCSAIKYPVALHVSLNFLWPLGSCSERERLRLGYFLRPLPAISFGP